MAKKRKSKHRKDVQNAKPGRKPESLRIEGSWKDAVSSALKRGKPPKEVK
jgi:hypothetical protein